MLSPVLSETLKSEKIENKVLICRSQIVAGLRRHLGSLLRPTVKEGVGEDPIEKQMREAISGEIRPQPIVIADYDPAWPERFRR